VQVNCSGKIPLGGTAGDTHRVGEDDPLSYSVAVHASVLREGSEQGVMLFPSLRCAVRLRPGLVLVFQDIEPHRVTPLVPSHDLTAPLPPGYDDDTRIVCILYPKRDILNATRPRALPENERALAQVLQAPASLVEDSLASFGSRCQQSRWTKHEMLHSMRRSATSLVPRTRVDFAALSAAVHPFWPARQRNSGGGQSDRREHDEDDSDDEHPDADEPHECSAGCFRYADLLANERRVAIVMREYLEAAKLVRGASLLYDPVKKEPALPAAPAAGNAGDGAATGSDETLAADPAATSGDNGDNGDSGDNGNKRRKRHAESERQ
jgi:hypothetical protein